MEVLMNNYDDWSSVDDVLDDVLGDVVDRCYAAGCPLPDHVRRPEGTPKEAALRVQLREVERTSRINVALAKIGVDEPQDYS